MTRLSNWREESDLFEVVTGKMTDEKALKKVDDKKGIKNKVIINPKLTEAIKKLGGELIEVTEEEQNGGPLDSKKEADKRSEDQKKKQVEQKQKRAQMIKKQVLMKKLIAVRQGSEDIVAHHEPKGNYVKEASAVLDANTKIKNKDDRKKKEAELRRLLNHAIAMKKGRAESVKPEGEAIDERTLSSYIPSDRQGEARRANLDYTKAQLKKKEDESTKNRGDLSKRDAGKMAKQRLHNKRIMSMGEAKVDQGRSDYGKASIRNYRRSGPGHGEPAMFDSDNKRGKTIDKRREEHKARRGVKGAKVPAYKVEHHQKDKDGNTIPHENLNELNRYGKETGKATGSMNKRPGSPVKKGGSGDKALNVVRGMIRKQQGKPEGQQKKVKGVKSDAGTGKYLDKQKSKKEYAAKAKKAGYKNPQDYTNVVARYGSEDNMKRGRGLGT